MEEYKTSYDFLNRYNITYSNIELYDMAFTHSSYANECQIESNQRLEFLGDSVLNLIIVEHLYKKFALFLEGELSQMKSYIICSDALIEAGNKLELSLYLKVSRGFKKNSLKNDKVYEDCFEAVVGAMFLDSDMEQCKRFILTHLENRIIDSEKFYKTSNQKTLFQEEIQKIYKTNPEYRTISKSSKNKQTCVGVYVNDRIHGIGYGNNIKIASMVAAERAMEKLRRDLDKEQIIEKEQIVEKEDNIEKEQDIDKDNPIYKNLNEE